MGKGLHAWSINCDPCSCKWQHSVQSLHHWKHSKKPTSSSVVTLRDSCTIDWKTSLEFFICWLGVVCSRLDHVVRSSLLAQIHTNGFQTPLELPQNVMYHVVFVKHTFQAGIRIVKICTKYIIPIMTEQIVYWKSWTAKEKESVKETVESTNFIHSSRKAWSLLRKLGTDSNTGASSPTHQITANDIASRLQRVSKVPMD
jgi:hypothetical protein